CAPYKAFVPLGKPATSDSRHLSLCVTGVNVKSRGRRMAKLAQLPGINGAIEAAPGARREPRLRTRYYAFLSYSHRAKEPADWLASDVRSAGEGQRMAFLQLVAGMLGVGLDELVQREQTRRHRRMAWLAAASLAGMAVTSTLAVTALQARNEAREQRREA